MSTEQCEGIVVQLADATVRRRQRIGAAIRAIKQRITGTERLSDELYAEVAERFDVTERELQREWVRIHWGPSSDVVDHS